MCEEKLESAGRVIGVSRVVHFVNGECFSRVVVAVRRTDIFTSLADVTLVKFNRNGIERA